METLPEELFLHLTTYLDGWHCIALSHTCSRFLGLLGNNHFWKQVFKRESLVRDTSLVGHASSLTSPGEPLEKWNYMVHSRIRKNWKNSKFKNFVIPMEHKYLVGNDDRHLTVWEENNDQTSWNVAVYEIGGKEMSMVIHRPNWSIDKPSDSKSLSSILVSQGVAVLCFRNENHLDPQLIVAVDLKDLGERWRDRCDLTRSFGSDVYCFNFATYSINISNIRSQAHLYSIPLPLGIRLLEAEISGDGLFLAFSGKMIMNNTPAVSVTNVRSHVHHYLQSSTPVCPYRRFEKTEVYEGKVFGMLSRRSLFIWDATNGAEIRKLDLSESPPGGQELSQVYNFLKVGYGIAATIHSEPSCINILSMESPVHQPPIVLDLNMFTGGLVKVCDVYINSNCLIVKSVNVQGPQCCTLAIFPLPIQLDPKLMITMINITPKDNSSINEVRITPAKILQLQEQRINVLDCS